jgi:hypothetical protein
LIGHLVVSLFPGIHRAFTLTVAVVGLLVLFYVLLRHRPTTPAALSRLVAWVMTVAILLAPATRVGYLLYPVDLFVWTWLLRSEDTVDPVPADPARVPSRVAVGGSGVDVPSEHDPGDGDNSPRQSVLTGGAGGSGAGWRSSHSSAAVAAPRNQLSSDTA